LAAGLTGNLSTQEEVDQSNRQLYQIIEIGGVSTMMPKEEYRELIEQSSIISIQKVMRGVVGRRVIADLKKSKAHQEGVVEAEKKGEKEAEKEGEFIISDDEEDIPIPTKESVIVTKKIVTSLGKESRKLSEDMITSTNDVPDSKDIVDGEVEKEVEDEGERVQNEVEEEESWGEKKPFETVRRKTDPVTSSSIIVTPRKYYPLNLNRSPQSKPRANSDGSTSQFNPLNISKSLSRAKLGSEKSDKSLNTGDNNTSLDSILTGSPSQRKRKGSDERNRGGSDTVEKSSSRSRHNSFQRRNSGPTEMLEEAMGCSDEINTDVPAMRMTQPKELELRLETVPIIEGENENLIVEDGTEGRLSVKLPLFKTLSGGSTPNFQPDYSIKEDDENDSEEDGNSGKTKRESVLSVVVEESRKNSFDGFLKDGFNEEKEDIQII